MTPYTNLPDIEEDYVSADDEDYVDDLGDGVSKISMDDYSRDTKTVGHKSVYFNENVTEHNIPVNSPKASAFLHGSETIILPYVLDHWYDENSRHRISLQVLLPSGKNYREVKGRVSTCQKYFVLNIPMTCFMSDSKKGLVSLLYKALKKMK